MYLNKIPRYCWAKVSTLINEVETKTGKVGAVPGCSERVKQKVEGRFFIFHTQFVGHVTFLVGFALKNLH